MPSCCRSSAWTHAEHRWEACLLKLKSCPMQSAMHHFTDGETEAQHHEAPHKGPISATMCSGHSHSGGDLGYKRLRGSFRGAALTMQLPASVCSSA